MRAVLVTMVCALLAASVARAQRLPDEWGRYAPPVFRHILQADGLPYPVALGIVQDRRGFIWVATPGGAGRWDGYRMENYRHDDSDPTSIPENILTNVVTDEKGRVWFCTASGVLARYDEATDGFISYRRPEGSLGRPNNMAHDGQGGILIAARQGLFRLEAATGAWSRIDGVPDGEVSSVMVDRDGQLWAGTAKGLFRRQTGNGSFTLVSKPPGTKIAPISALYQDAAGLIWFGTRFGRVGRVSADLSTVTLEPALPGSGYRVTAIAEIAPGTMWFSEYGGGIREFMSDTRKVRGFTHDPATPTSLGDNAVTSLLKDRSGLIWASSLRGVHRYIPNNRQIVTLVEDGKGLPGKDVRSVAAAADGKAWLGFRESAGLATLDPYTGDIGRGPSGRWPKSSPRGLIQAIADTGDGRLWVGQQSGLTIIDTVHGHAETYAPLEGQNILALHPFGDSLWVGGAMGLARIPLDGGEPQMFRTSLNDDHSLSDNTVSAIFHDAAGRLWVGTMRGLNRLDDIHRGRFMRFVHDPADRDGLPSDVVNAITQDRYGFLWLATGNGIAMFNPDAVGKITFTRFGTKDGLRTGTVLSVIEAEDGSILAGSGDGLVIVERSALSARTLDPSNGVEIRTFWAGAAARLADGTVVLGGFGGLVLVRPNPLPVGSHDSPVVITDLRVGGKKLPAATDITLQPGDGSVQVEFAALDYAAPERHRYSYRLNSEKWVTTDAYQRTATYTNLPPGTHTLTIRAANGAGLWGNPPLLMNIKVLPEWHQTTLFRLSVTAAAIGLLLSAFQIRKAGHLRRERELTQEVQARTREAEAAKLRALEGEEAARRAKEIAEAADQTKSRFLAIIGHEIRTPLNGLLGMLHLLEPRALSPHSHEMLATAKEAGETLRHLVESIVEYGRLGAEAPEPVLSDVDIDYLVGQIVKLLRPQAAAKNLSLKAEFALDGMNMVKTDPSGLSRILLNLVGNAIKFTDHGGVSINTVIAEGENGCRLVVTVDDTGIGVPDEMREAIFSEFTQADDSITRRYGGVGLGLAICRRMAARLGGDLSLDCSARSGSRFVLELPVTPGRRRQAPNAGERFDAGPSLRIMVVDDDAINLRVAERMLTRMGHQVVTVDGGLSAMALAGQRTFDLILMDLRMPDMDGLEATRGIKRIAPGARVVCMTAEYADEVWSQCLQAGMDGRLLKPIDPELLAGIVSGQAGVTRGAAAFVGRIDRDYLRQQRDILGFDELLGLVRVFIRVTRETLPRLAAAIDAADHDTATAIAHRLRSSAGPLGLAGFAALARRIELEAPTAPQSELQTLFQTLKQARTADLKALKAFART